MRTDNNTLIAELLDITERATASAQHLRSLDNHTLNFRERDGSWSVLECIEHLNRYGDYYLPEIQKALESNVGGRGIYKSGLIGGLFANLMRIKNGKIIAMKTPADKNPAGENLNVLNIDRFLKQQELLKTLLFEAGKADLVRTKVPTSLNRFIRMRLGDTLRFFVYHIERHIVQAERVARNAG